MFTLGIIIISLLSSAFFSGMEIAYISSNKLHIELEKNQGNFISKLIAKLMDNPSKFIASMLIGNNISLVIYGMYSGIFIIQMLFPNYVGRDLPIWLLLIQTIISTIVILFTAEFLPKIIFKLYSNRALKIFAIPVFVIYKVLSFLKITGFMVWVSNYILSLMGQKIDNEESVFTRADLENYISENMQNTSETIDNEVHIFQNALEFSNLKVRECMIHRKNIIALQKDTSIEELSNKFTETGLSKIFIYKENIDDIIGYVHMFELLKKPKSIKKIINKIGFISESISATKALNQMLSERKNTTVVLDEYGGTAGILTLEDLVEELFGEIEDEHDDNLPELLENKISDTEYQISSSLEISYLNEKYNLKLPESKNYETISGLILEQTEDIPTKNSVINIDNFTFVIKKSKGSNIEEVVMMINN